MELDEALRRCWITVRRWETPVNRWSLTLGEIWALCRIGWERKDSDTWGEESRSLDRLTPWVVWSHNSVSLFLDWQRKQARVWHRKISIGNGMGLHEEVERSRGESEYFKLNILRRQAKFKRRGCQKTWNARIEAQARGASRTGPFQLKVQFAPVFCTSGLAHCPPPIFWRKRTLVVVNLTFYQAPVIALFANLTTSVPIYIAGIVFLGSGVLALLLPLNL